MEGHARVLQHWIQVAAIGGHRQQAFERVGREDDEGEKTDRHETEHTEHARHEHLGQAAAQRGERQGPHVEDKDPQQQRTFMRTPHGRHAVVPGQGEVGIVGDVTHREIELQESPYQQAERQRHEHRLTGSGRSGDSHQGTVVAPGADQWQGALGDGQQQGQDQRELTEFRRHCGLSCPAASFTCLPSCALAMASFSSFGI